MPYYFFCVDIKNSSLEIETKYTFYGFVDGEGETREA
jgi:hypothetical protein